MERRKFLKDTCNVCLLGAAGYILPLSLFSCAPSRSAVYKTKINDNKVEVPLSLFANGNIQFIRPKGWFYDMAVVKNGEDSYTALLMMCTHMDNELFSTGNGFHCNLHSSHFDLEGKVKKGPAQKPLQRYKVAIEKDNLIITV